MSIERIKKIFQESIQVKQTVAELLPNQILIAAKAMVDSLKGGHKILTCGNGGSACDAVHFATEMINRFLKDRAPIPAIALTTDLATITAIANDYSYSEIFAKQLDAIGNSGDTLLAISTSGNAQNICYAVETAHNKYIKVIALTGKDGGKLSSLLTKDDIEIKVPSQSTPRIQEVHLLIIHCLCEYIENKLFEVNHA